MATLTHNVALHRSYVERAHTQGPPLIFFGDSITEGWRNVPDLWLARFARYGGEHFGVGGDLAQELLWRITDGEICSERPPQGVVVLIGTNNLKCNTPSEITDTIRAILDEVHRLAPQARILLLGVLPRGVTTPQRAGFPQAIRELNAALTGYEDGNSIFFVDLGELFLRADGSIDSRLMPDGCHLSPAGYEVFADALAPQIERLMGPAFVPRESSYLPCVTRWKTTGVIASPPPLAELNCPDVDALGASVVEYPFHGFVNEHRRWQHHAGQMYFAARLALDAPMELEFLMGYDGPFRLWLNDRPFFEDLAGTNPCQPDKSAKVAELPAGSTRITVAMDTNRGNAWGFFLHFRRLATGTLGKALGDDSRPRYQV